MCEWVLLVAEEKSTFVHLTDSRGALCWRPQDCPIQASLPSLDLQLTLKLTANCYESPDLHVLQGAMGVGCSNIRVDEVQTACLLFSRSGFLK